MITGLFPGINYRLAVTPGMRSVMPPIVRFRTWESRASLERESRVGFTCATSVLVSFNSYSGMMDSVYLYCNEYNVPITEKNASGIQGVILAKRDKIDFKLNLWSLSCIGHTFEGFLVVRDFHNPDNDEYRYFYTEELLVTFSDLDYWTTYTVKVAVHCRAPEKDRYERYEFETGFTGWYYMQVP